MNHARSAVAACALTLSAANFGAPTATANHPAENGPPAGTVLHDPPPPKTVEIQVEVPVDDTKSEVAQAGASALGGALVAIGVIWVHRRRPAGSA